MAGASFTTSLHENEEMINFSSRIIMYCCNLIVLLSVLLINVVKQTDRILCSFIIIYFKNVQSSFWPIFIIRFIFHSLLVFDDESDCFDSYMVEALQGKYAVPGCCFYCSPFVIYFPPRLISCVNFIIPLHFATGLEN